MGQVAWSPELEAALLVHRFWSILLLRRDGHKITARRLLRMAKRTGLESALTAPRELIVQQKAEAWSVYKSKKKESVSLRAQWLEDLALARIEAGLEPAEKALRLMEKREQVRREFQTIKRATKPVSKRALIRVRSTNENGVSKVHTSKTGIERAGLKENDNRFRQSKETPLQQEQAVQLLGRTGCSDAATAILQTGKVPRVLAEQDPFLEEYLQAHQRTTDQEIDISLPTEAHQFGWSKVKEQTSSGRSGLHFGHFIAGCGDDNIAALEACLSSIPWQTGYAPSRWKQGLNIMIEKKEGVIDVERLRTILLLEADYNQGNKGLGPEAHAVW